MPHHALAVGVDPGDAAPPLPHAPLPPPATETDASPASRTRRLAQQDEAPRPLLTIAPQPQPAGPLITMADRWQDEIDNSPPVPDDGAPLGLNMEQGEQPALEPTPG